MANIIVGLSGGVDSSVSAALLLEQGHDVEALFMFNWADDEDAYCTAAEDYEMAQQVAADLGVRLHRADFSAQYRERVFAHFLNEYRAGRTPSPDLLCNREIKFDAFLSHALQLGADAIATGHYARVQHDGSCGRLFQAKDEKKDQTYFLASVNGTALKSVYFPLGDYTKPEVRDMAQARGLANYQRKDSTGICFIGERPMREFLGRYLESLLGPIIDDHEMTVGQHAGLCYYTIGQRKGLGIGGQRHAVDAPWFVYAKEKAGNVLRVTQNAAHPMLMRSRTHVEDAQWIAGRAPSLPWRGSARIRHRQALQDCRLEIVDDRFLLSFKKPQWAIAPGQYAVFYDGDECLGCATISDEILVDS